MTFSVQLMAFCGHDPHFPDEETESQKRGGSLTFYSPTIFEYLLYARSYSKHSQEQDRPDPLGAV